MQHPSLSIRLTIRLTKKKSNHHRGCAQRAVERLAQLRADRAARPAQAPLRPFAPLLRELQPLGEHLGRAAHSLLPGALDRGAGDGNHLVPASDARQVRRPERHNPGHDDAHAIHGKGDAVADLAPTVRSALRQRAAVRLCTRLGFECSGKWGATDQSKEPPSMIAPPMAVPWPPVHLVRDVQTTSTP